MWFILANWPLYDLREQPPALTYRGADGKIRMHTPDFLATLRCGRRIAIAVKPAKNTRKPEFVRQLKCIRKSLPKTYADDFLLFTDANFTLTEALNAQRFCTFRRYVSAADLEQLDAELARCAFPITLMSLAERLEGQNAGFRTVFTGIYAGKLTTDRKSLITPQTLLYRGDVN
ncbi:TnsA endonuclease N-terminal domain-containing protein [Halocynthiibacter sp.]|uniref:TnsA endonuclease N-terminal domain-containing protein n=1 Tax=Halocynthiibacter sp. TaxID=1979210 RepID=UPI003C6F0EB1